MSIEKSKMFNIYGHSLDHAPIPAESTHKLLSFRGLQEPILGFSLNQLTAMGA